MRNTDGIQVPRKSKDFLEENNSRKIFPDVIFVAKSYLSILFVLVTNPSWETFFPRAHIRLFLHRVLLIFSYSSWSFSPCVPSIQLCPIHKWSVRRTGANKIPVSSERNTLIRARNGIRVKIWIFARNPSGYNIRMLAPRDFTFCLVSAFPTFLPNTIHSKSEIQRGGTKLWFSWSNISIYVCT